MPQSNQLWRYLTGGSLMLALSASISLLSGNLVNFTFLNNLSFLNNFLNRQTHQNIYIAPSEPQTQPTPTPETNTYPNLQIPIDIQIPFDPTVEVNPSTTFNPSLEVNPHLEWNFEAGGLAPIEIAPNPEIAPLQPFDSTVAPITPPADFGSGLTLINPRTTGSTMAFTQVILQGEQTFFTPPPTEETPTLLAQLPPSSALVSPHWLVTPSPTSTSSPSQLSGLILVAAWPLGYSSRKLMG
ncbi:MAG: hypothetical protein ACTS3T_19290 [Almyronema sp.]